MTLDLKRIFATDGSTLPFEYEGDMSTVDYAGGFPLQRPVIAKALFPTRRDSFSCALRSGTFMKRPVTVAVSLPQNRTRSFSNVLLPPPSRRRKAIPF